MESFTYNGRSTTEFNLVIAGYQTRDIPFNLKRTTVASSINKYRRKVNVYGTNYDSVLTFNISVMKNPCSNTQTSNQEDLKFTREEIRQITAWLTSPISPRLFHPDVGYDFMGMFTNVEADDTNIFLLNLTFECDTPYALSDVQRVTIDSSSGIVSNPSDEYEDYVYPILTITPKTSGSHTITITNVTDDNRSVTFTNMKNLDVVTMDCQKLTIKNKSGSLMSFDNIDIEGLDYIYWPRLLHGDNTFTITNGAEVTFEFRYPVKAGVY